MHKILKGASQYEPEFYTNSANWTHFGPDVSNKNTGLRIVVKKEGTVG